MNDRTVVESFDRTVLENLRDFRRQYAPLAGWLTVWSGTQRGADFPLCQGRNFVGTHAECQVSLTDPQAADFLFNVRISGRVWTLIDLDSDRGVLKNDIPTCRSTLADGDWIRVGDLLMRVKMRA